MIKVDHFTMKIKLIISTEDRYYVAIITIKLGCKIAGMDRLNVPLRDTVGGDEVDGEEGDE